MQKKNLFEKKIIENVNSLLIPHKKFLLPIVKDLQEEKAHVFLVGGIVRNSIKNSFTSDDIDIEVHNIKLNKLQNILSKYGTVLEHGKIFGVLHIKNSSIEWTIPRQDNSGRKPKVTFFDEIDIKTALERRDFTMNSIAIEITTDRYTLHDPFGGINDIEHSILRATNSNRFQEDPLRFFRIISFISRFAVMPDETLSCIAKTMCIEKIAQERIIKEYEKVFLKGSFVTKAIEWTITINRFEELFKNIDSNIFISYVKDYQKTNSEERSWIHILTFLVLSKITKQKHPFLNSFSKSTLKKVFILEKIISDKNKKNIRSMISKSDFILQKNNLSWKDIFIITGKKNKLFQEYEKIKNTLITKKIFFALITYLSI